MSLCNVILDILLVAMIAWGGISGAKRGFVRVVFMKMKRVTAIVVAALLAKPVGNLLKTKFFLEPVTTKIRDLLTEALGTDTATASAEQMSENLPLAIKGILNLMGISVADKAAEAEAAGGNLLDQFASTIAEPAARVLGIIVAFFAVYFVFRLLLRVIVAFINAIFNLPGLRIVNVVLGVVFGLFFAAVFAWVTIAVLGYFGDLLAGSSIGFFREFDIEKTLLAKYVYRFKPIDFIFSIK